MPQVTVEFEAYQTGSLPGVCVFTGVPTSDRMVFITPVRDAASGSKRAGGLVGSFDRVFDTLDPRKPRNTLLGRLPIDAETLEARRRKLRSSRVLGWVALLVFVIASWAGAAWSPVVALSSLVVVGVSTARRLRLERQAPVATLIGAGTRVHLDHVHEAFVAAVEADR